MSMTVTITRTKPEDIDVLSTMFDEYRRFYKQPSDIEACREFLSERIKTNQSVAYIAYLEERPAGFVHLYPTFSSIYLKRIWILNDLFVHSTARRQGVGFGLIDAAKKLALETNALCIKASTGQSNFAAQQVYESKDFRRDYQFFHYVMPFI